MGAGKFYNGVNPNQITRDTAESNDRLGIHHLARRGIAGRAVLLDYGRWALKNNPEFDPFKRIEITVQELEQVAEAQGVTFEPADILLVRTGWMAQYERYGEEVKNHIDDKENPSCAGVKACEETFRWIWDHHFAAVGSDNFPFEAFPPKAWEDSCRTYKHTVTMYMHKLTYFILRLRLLGWIWHAYWRIIVLGCTCRRFCQGWRLYLLLHQCSS